MTVEPCPQTRLLGAYALGTLEPADRAVVDGHLLNCPACAAELSELATLVPLLATVTVDDVVGLPADDAEGPAPDLFDRVADAVAADRSRSARRRRALIAAVAAGVVAAGVGVGVGLSLTGQRAAAPTYQASAGGVHIDVELDGRPTGTELRVSVTGVREGEHCRLIAVATDGTRQVAGTWVAAYDGRAEVTTSTSLPPNRIADLVLLGTGGRRLVTLPTA